MNASHNQKKTLSFGLALIPIAAMLLLLIVAVAGICVVLYRLFKRARWL